jgi:hypothetical protein
MSRTALFPPLPIVEDAHAKNQELCAAVIGDTSRSAASQDQANVVSRLPASIADSAQDEQEFDALFCCLGMLSSKRRRIHDLALKAITLPNVSFRSLMRSRLAQQPRA